MQVEEKVEEETSKVAKVNCFNCGGCRHYNTDCKELKLCFVCETISHVGRECPEWKKPLVAAQYLGSVVQGLGFFHVDVQEESSGIGFLKCLDNCAVLTVEEGEISREEIVDNLQKIFDNEWHWQLRGIEEFKYLVRFPPHKKIANTVISDTTYFKMKKEGVLVSLSVWNGNIEPYDSLEEVWVQLSGFVGRGSRHVQW
jgi:hypothetical protein